MPASRVESVREKLIQKKLDGLLVMQPENRRYLSGFTGTAGALVITLKETYFLTDFRYLEQAELECPGWKVYEAKISLFDSLAEYIPGWNLLRLGFEDDFITYKQFTELQVKLDGTTLAPSSGLVENLRRIKEKSEIETLKKAAELADRAFLHIMDFIRPGRVEREVAEELEFFMRRKGAKKNSFDFIVASGYRGSLPHGVASNKILQSGELVTMDYGCEFEGYCSDITRTVSLGPLERRQEQVYNIVLEAQTAGLGKIKPGVKASEVDGAVRSVFEKYGYLDNFRHSTGHGVGLTVHENPRLSIKDETILAEGMVLTVEPGIYFPGWGGVRIEDMVVVEKKGCRRLTGAPRDQLIVCNSGCIIQ